MVGTWLSCNWKPLCFGTIFCSRLLAALFIFILPFFRIQYCRSTVYKHHVLTQQVLNIFHQFGPKFHMRLCLSWIHLFHIKLHISKFLVYSVFKFTSTFVTKNTRTPSMTGTVQFNDATHVSLQYLLLDTTRVRANILGLSGVEICPLSSHGHNNYILLALQSSKKPASTGIAIKSNLFSRNIW